MAAVADTDARTVGTTFTAPDANDIWAVGHFSTLAGSAIESGGYALHWDGTAWTPTSPTPSGGADLSGVAATPGSPRRWAVGTIILTRNT